MSKPRVLCADLVGDHGHANTDRTLLAALQPHFEVTLTARPDYLAHFQNESATLIPLPEGIPLKGKGKVLHRINQVFRWQALKKQLSRTHYDAVVIFNYEVITACLLAPRQRDLWSIEHNVIDKARESGFKLACYRKLPARWGHFVFLDYIGSFIADTTGRRAVTLPHPLFISTVDEFPVPEAFPAGKKVIFAPSGSNDRQVMALAKQVLADHPGFVLAARGPVEDSCEGFISRPRFDDYPAWIKNAHAVFFCGNFTYRASGVIFDALSLGTPAVVHDSLLGQKMHELHPHAVQVVKHPAELVELSLDENLVQEECRKFRSTHSLSELTQVFAQTLGLNPR